MNSFDVERSMFNVQRSVSNSMKRLLVLVDAAADFPYPELQDRTPLNCARMPTAKVFATEGRVGQLRIRRTGPDASRSLLAEAMGFSPRAASRLRWGPLGILSRGESWTPGRVAYLAHWIHVDGDGHHHPVSPTSAQEQESLLQDLEADLRENVPEAEASLRSLTSGRFVLTVTSAGNWLSTSPVMYHQAEFLQRIDPMLHAVLDQIRFQLEFHSINALRLDLGELPISSAWCWSGGHRVPEAPLREFSSALASSDPVIRGLAELCGVPFVQLPDPYQKRGGDFPSETVRGLLQEHEELLIWIPAPFASEQFQEPQEKVRRLDEMDYRLFRPIRKILDQQKPARLLLTAAGVRHRGRPERGTAPCLLWGADVEPDTAEGWMESAGLEGSLGAPRWASLLQTFRKST